MTKNKPVLERHWKAAEHIATRRADAPITPNQMAQIIANAEPSPSFDPEAFDEPLGDIHAVALKLAMLGQHDLGIVLAKAYERMTGFLMRLIDPRIEPPSLNDAKLLDRIQACTEENTELHKRIERLEVLVKDWPHVGCLYSSIRDASILCHRCQVEAILHPKENAR